MSDERFHKLSELWVDALHGFAKPPPSVWVKRLPLLSKMVGGFRPREFTILCGATGVGKTTFLANLSLGLLQEDVPQLVASVETGRLDFVKRICSALQAENWNDGQAVPMPNIKSFTQANSKFMKNAPLYLSIYEDRVKHEQLLQDITRAIKERGVKFVMLDNLNFFMEVVVKDSQILEMDRVVHDFIIFCKQNDVHIMLVMHPRKTQTGRVESEFDIKGSSTASQEAHNIFLLNRPHKDLLDGPHDISNLDRELTITKVRRGGQFIGKSLIFKCTNGVTYTEKTILEK